jgi:NCAIR mutase (PurE)-related protein
LRKLLEQVKADQASVDEAMEQLRHLPFEDLGFAHLDHHRQIRRGFPEVIYCPGKTTEQVVEIFANLASKGNNVLATRAEEDVFSAVAAKVPGARYDEQAKAIVLEQKKLSPSKSEILILTAGTADLPGVAGLHRLLGHTEKLQAANVVIVVAGMEGALASVVGGLVSCPVIAVPTSIGSGTSFGGIAALLTMLNSCASGVVVANIDNGFSAGVTATLINRKIEGWEG